MNYIHLLLVLQMFFLNQIQGEMIAKSLETGEDLTLNVTEDLGDVDTLSWFCNGSVFATFYSNGETKEAKDYKGRLGHFDLKLVTLKSLRTSDSGVYSAKVTGTKWKELSTKYNITVQGVKEAGQESVKWWIVALCLLVIAVVAVAFAAVVAAALWYILWAMLKLSPEGAVLLQDQKEVIGSASFATTSSSKMPLLQGDLNV